MKFLSRQTSSDRTTPRRVLTLAKELIEPTNHDLRLGIPVVTATGDVNKAIGAP